LGANPAVRPKGEPIVAERNALGTRQKTYSP
jgi:hypothetical protein